MLTGQTILALAGGIVLFWVLVYVVTFRVHGGKFGLRRRKSARRSSRRSFNDDLADTWLRMEGLRWNLFWYGVAVAAIGLFIGWIAEVFG